MTQTEKELQSKETESTMSNTTTDGIATSTSDGSDCNNEIDHAEELDVSASCASTSAWNVATSPMLTCLHRSPHSGARRSSPAVAHPHHHQQPKRQRSRSMGDEVDEATLLILIPELEHQQQQPTDYGGNGGRTSKTSLGMPRSDLEEVVEDDAINNNNPIGISIMYGLINATIVLPVLMSFGSIIYRDDAFQPYLNVLIKLTVVSGFVHQICFSTLSSLPFAVGQVQDAGLIFLSSMAGMLVKTCRNEPYNADDETLLATVTVGLSLCTALLGLSLIVIGKAKLAQWVQLLPTCVVGGYLAYIGYFCGISGVGLMAGTSDVITLEIFIHKARFILPGIVGGLGIYTLVRKLQHMVVLPTMIVLLFCLFYLILWIQGMSVEEATRAGWIAKTDPPPVWYRSWDYLKLDKVIWAALPQLIVTEISMIFVVALSSSLDIAAIEIELKRPLDYDKELKMVGISNFISGITGGYTGSYIFSQSIFSLRAGIRSRLAGYTLALCQILFFVAPFSILAYVPGFFFGSLLSLICVDLMFEWLYESRHKLTKVEYLLCLATFGLILFTGVEYGIILGVLLFLVCKKLGFNVSDIELPSTTTTTTTTVEPADRESGVGYGSVN